MSYKLLLFGCNEISVRLFNFPPPEDNADPELDDIDEEDEEAEAALLEEEEEEEMELEQAPPTKPIPAPVEPPVKRKRGRPPKNIPKPSPPAKASKAAPKGKAAAGELNLPDPISCDV